MEGRFPNLTISVEANPIWDTLYVRLTGVNEELPVNGQFLEALRKKLNAAEAEKESGIKFTLLVFVMKALATALQQLPQMNSFLVVI